MGPSSTIRPKVSVIVPVYNTQRYLSQCLDSLVGQTLGDLEIIVVNDGSTDASLSIAQEYQREFPAMTVVSQENKGLSAARNAGMRLARGEYIGFVDSDDWVDIRMYEKMYGRAKKDDSCLVIGDAKVFYQDLHLLTPFYDRWLWDAFAPHLKKRPFDLQTEWRVLVLEPAPWKRLYKRSFLERENVQFPEGLIFEDMPVHFRLLLTAQRISLLDEPLYFYRMGRRDKITARTDRTLFQVFDIFKLISKDLAERNVPIKYWSGCIKFQLRVLDWLSVRVNAQYRDEFVLAAKDHFRTIPRKAFSAFWTEFGDFNEDLKVLCFRRGWSEWLARIQESRMPLALKLYSVVKYRRYGKVKQVLKDSIGRLQRRINLLDQQLEPIHDKPNQLPSNPDAPDRKQTVSLSPLGTQDRSWIHTCKVLDDTFFFVDQVPKAGLDEAIERISNSFFLSENITLRKGDIVVDIGAHVGAFAVWLGRKYPDIRIFAFEPDATNFANLRRNIHLNGVENVVPVNKAVTGDGREAVLYKNRHHSGKATLRQAAAASYGDVETLSVESTTLNKIFRDLGIERCRLMVIDTPGCVQEILASFDRRNSIDYLCGEEEPEWCSSADLKYLSLRTARRYFWRRNTSAPIAGDNKHDWTVSVVVPAYNVEKYLAQCLDSLVSQTLPAMEIIVVDDESTDDTPKIIRQFQEQHPNIIHIEKAKGGCASARNAGLRLARGEYVGFVDGDDWAAPTMFAELYGRGAETDADIVQCGFQRFLQVDNRFQAEDEGWVEEVLRKAENRADQARSLLYLQPSIWRRIYRKSFVRKQGIEFPESVKMFDDLPFQTMVLACAKTVAVVNKTLYNYRLQRKTQDVGATDSRLMVHFDIFRILDEFTAEKDRQDVAPHLLRVKANTHDWALKRIEVDLWDEYFRKACVDVSGTPEDSLNRFYVDPEMPVGCKLQVFCLQKGKSKWYKKLQQGHIPILLKTIALARRF